MNWATISAVALRPARGNEEGAPMLRHCSSRRRSPEPVEVRVLERRERRAQRQLHGHEVDEQASGPSARTAELRVNQGGAAEERRVAQLERGARRHSGPSLLWSTWSPRPSAGGRAGCVAMVSRRRPSWPSQLDVAGVLGVPSAATGRRARAGSGLPGPPFAATTRDIGRLAKLSPLTLLTPNARVEHKFSSMMGLGGPLRSRGLPDV